MMGFSLKFFKTVFHTADRISIQFITRKNLPYVIGWISMFIWLYSYFLPFGGFRFESNLYNYKVGNSLIYSYVWLIVCPLITVIFDGRKYVPKTFYSVIAASVCFLLIRFIEAGILSHTLLFIGSACIGHIFASSCYLFFMVLNNSEKFFSMILAVLLPKLLMFLKPLLNHPELEIDASNIFIAFLLIVFAICSYLYRNKADEITMSVIYKVPMKAYSLMAVVFVVLVLNDVIAPTTLRCLKGISQFQRESLYFYGILCGVLLILLLQKHYLVNICNMLNLSFALISMGFIFSVLHSDTRSTGLISAFCFGISYALGIVNIYYLAGFMAKKFQSIRFYRIGIALSSAYYFFSFSVIKLSTKTTLVTSDEFMSIFSLGIVILFFSLSPMFIKMLYNGEWIDDAYRLDVTNTSRLEARLKELKLTPAETEVCKLLLEGYTLRQIAGMLEKSYSTINTYYSSIYKKLNINSRAELLLRFQDYVTK